MLKKRKLIPLALVIVMVLALAGCGGDTTTTGGEGVEAAGGDAILRVGWTSEPDILNPLTTYSTQALQIVNLVYEPLIGYGTDLETTYKLAESFEYSDDYLTVTYHLKQGVTWHDGEPFTADDVVGTYNIIKDYEIGEAAQYTTFLESVEAPDDYTVVMTFSEPQAFNLAHAVVILPMHIWGEMDADEIEIYTNDNPIGTGPMVYGQWRQGSTISVTKNENYHGEEPGPDQIIFIVYGNEDVLAQALKAGEIDVITELAPTVWEGLLNIDNIRAVNLPSFSFHMVGINCLDDDDSPGHPALRDATVRQALSYSMNRAQITEIALVGYGVPGETLIPVGMSEWRLNLADDELIDNDIEKAKEILEAAGYVDRGDGIREKDGVSLEFRIFAIESTAVDVRAAQIFRDSAEAAGIKLTLSTMDENTMGGIIFDEDNPDFDMFVWGWDSDFLDPGYLLGIPLTSQFGVNNDVYYSNPEYDRLYELQATEMNETKRQEYLDELQRIFYEDCGYLVLWNQDKLQAYREDKWTGWVESPGGIIYNVTYDNYINVKPVE